MELNCSICAVDYIQDDEYILKSLQNTIFVHPIQLTPATLATTNNQQKSKLCYSS